MIDGEQRLLQPIYNALIEQGFQVNLFHNPTDALLHLSKTDMLLLEAAVARQPKSSKFIQVPSLVVLTNQPEDHLPPWLQASHVFLVQQSQPAQDFIHRLANYLPPHIPKFGVDPTNTEHLALLFGLTQFLSGHLELNDLFERILALPPYLNAKFGALLIQEGDEIIYYRSTQPGREELTGPTGRRFAQRLLKDGLEGWVLRHREAVALPNTQADPRWFRASYLPAPQHSVVALPINLERVEAQGVYLAGHTTPQHFTSADIPLFKAALTQISLALENAILFKNQSQRSTQLALINEVSQAATSILNLDVMLTTVVQAIRRSFACHTVAVYLYNAATGQVKLQAKTIADRYKTVLEFDASTPYQSLVEWSATTGKTVLVNDVAQDSRFSFNQELAEIRAELCVPIALGIKTIGVLDLQSTQLEAFDKYHVAALETLADQLAIAIENARLYDTINQHINELKSLNEIGQAVTSTLDLRKTLTLVTDHTTRLMNVAAASVVLRDDNQREVWFAAASGEGSEAVIGLRMSLGQGLAGWVAEKGEPVIVPDVYADTRFFANVDKQSGFTTKSILCVPLQTKGHTIGAIEVMNKKNGDFNQDDLATLQALAIPAATAIENAQLYEEQIKTIKRLAETQSQLVQSAKLAAVGELAAGIAHEINSPLTAIIGLTSLLLDSQQLLSNDAVEDLQTVNEEARRARDIVRRLLNFARADIPKRQPTDFNQLIEEAILLVYTQSVSQKIILKKSLAPLPQMFLDVNQIKQVVVNLLNNAVQAMADNRKRPAILTITTHTKQLTGHNGLDGSDPNQHIVCIISDTGKGISPDHLDKIFDPFFTTKEVGQGTGLGLSISYGIIEQHGGHISAASTPHQGSTFTISLPVSVIEETAQDGKATMPAAILTHEDVQ